MKHKGVKSFCKGAAIALSAAAVLTVAPIAHAELVTNGSFEATSNGNGQLGFNTDVTGWSVPAPPGSYAFVYAAGTGDTVGANGQYGNVSIWGPNNGSANGLPAASPDGGNYLAADGSFQDGAITQTLNGLTAGDTYAVTFYWAAAQQFGFTGGTTSGWSVDLGSAPAQSVSASIGSEGFSGWAQATLDFTADNTSDVLSFLALPTGGEPPFSLLDGVSAADVSTPEPGTWALMFAGVFGALGVSRARQWFKR